MNSTSILFLRINYINYQSNHALCKITQQIDADGNVNLNVAYGYNYWSGSSALYEQNLNYLAPLPDNALTTNQSDFDLLAEKTYECTRAELMRACVLDCLKRHEQV